MKTTEKRPAILKVIIGICMFGALLFIAFNGYQFGTWLKHIVG